MRPSRLFQAALLVVGLALSARPATAATLKWFPPTWANREGTNRRIDVLNRQDCLDNATATFGVQVLGASSSAVLEVWAGTNCDNLANRTGSGGTKTCVQVTAGVNAVSNPTEVKARLQDMVLPYDSTGVDTGTAASCDLEPSPGLVPRSLFFVVYNTGTTMSEASAMPWNFKYDVKAPAPPTDITAGAGEDSLITSFKAPVGETNLLRYHFYCSLVGASAGVTNTAGTGGTSATVGTDTGGATDTGSSSPETGGASDGDGDSGDQSDDPSCTSSVLVPGAPAPSDAIDCGSIGAQGADGGETTQVLENSVRYAVAIATEDDANNIGVLSKLGCGVPQDVTGFYEAYRNAGGQAGGGFCSFSPARHGAFASLLALGLGASLLLRRRR